MVGHANKAMLFGLVVLLLAARTAGEVLALSTSGVIITEIQTTGASDAGAEFVKVYNQGGSAVVLDGWKLQYKSAAGSSWTTKAVVTGGLDVGSALIIASSGYATAETHQTMSGGLAQAGGHVQLVDAEGLVQDLVGWGTAISAEAAAAPAPDKDQSLLRKISGGSYIDTDSNLSDFTLEVMPLPPPEPPSPALSPKPSVTEPKVLAATNIGLKPPSITELLPNPVSPQTDANDEFVELYNPNSTAFSLRGYKLQAGKTYSYSLSFSDEQIDAGGYLVITSGESSLTLSNSSGGVRLLDPSGKVIAQAEEYGKAEGGQSWANIDGVWQWSNQPTPGAANMLGAGSEDSDDADSQISTTSSASKSSKSFDPPASARGDGQNSKRIIHSVIIALIGCLALGYAVYEYRHDFGNLIYRFRTYRENRRINRQISSGR